MRQPSPLRLPREVSRRQDDYLTFAVDLLMKRASEDVGWSPPYMRPDDGFEPSLTPTDSHSVRRLRAHEGSVGG